MCSCYYLPSILAGAKVCVAVVSVVVACVAVSLADLPTIVACVAVVVAVVAVIVAGVAVILADLPSL